MRLPFITTGFFLAFLLTASGQQDEKKEKLSPEQAKDLLKQINIDSISILSELSRKACHCIDSITLNKKGNTEIAEDISKCIEEQAGAYELSMKLFRSMQDGNLNSKIYFDADKKSKEHQKYYFDIERWLKDSCQSLNLAVASNNKESAASMTKNPQSLQEYYTGVDWLKKEDYPNALIWFQKAVITDPNFAFGWDNLGICHRRLGNMDAALESYNRSLQLDPKGVTPLHNIPIVFEYLKKYDKALEAYQKLLSIYPNDPEAYYGTGRIYTVYVVDLEKALRNMCKAYNLYINISSPYRVDAEKNINYIYSKMKAEGKEKIFFDILKENNINAGN